MGWFDEKRSAPAFQVYASDELAREWYFNLSLRERGLLDAMRRACWVSDDGTIPRDATGIALLVRRPVEEVSDALTDAVLRQFQRTPNDARIFDAELMKQREKIENTRRRQSEGSAAGRAAIEERRRKKKKRGNSLRGDPVSGPVTGPVLGGMGRAGMGRVIEMPDRSPHPEDEDDDFDLEEYLQ